MENMGPGRFGPVLYRTNNAKKEVKAMRWGLIPSFTKSDSKADHFIMFNARSESVSQRPAFRRLLDTKRCIVIANGYFEWQHVGKEKQPYYIHRSRPLKVVLSEEHAAEWISNSSFADVNHVLSESTVEDFDVYPVDKKVGSTKHQEPGLADRIHLTRSGNMTKFLAPKDEEIEEGSKSSIPMKRTQKRVEADATSPLKKKKTLHPKKIVKDKTPQQTLFNYFQKTEESS
ncbi:unnamed protein product [Albugo candida]|uniref:Embryonic stem cell-specific 5-hydroxymethylcytosine-binding protein n=1 Tax=Albugo candida TaxID=65357 RepID=A0A024GJ16_9STRA|nr:unnamed protein product [Albugo candida]|eukprot:CCI46696.1 unnamed protein product [Albugo candida]